MAKRENTGKRNDTLAVGHSSEKPQLSAALPRAGGRNNVKVQEVTKIGRENHGKALERG